MKKTMFLLLAAFCLSIAGCGDSTKDASLPQPEDSRFKITDVSVTDGTTSVSTKSAQAKKSVAAKTDGEPTYATYVTWETWCYDTSNGIIPESWDDRLNNYPGLIEHLTYKTYTDTTLVTGTVVSNTNIKGLADSIFLHETMLGEATVTLKDGTVVHTHAGDIVYNGLPYYGDLDPVTGESINIQIHLAVRATVHFSDDTTTQYVKLCQFPYSEVGSVVEQFFCLPVGSTYVQDVALALTFEVDESIVDPKYLQ